MTLSEILANLSTQYPTTEPAQPIITKLEPVFCKLCRWNDDDISPAGYCPDCQATIDRGYSIDMLAGRCANGSEMDKGSLFHARRLSDNSPEWEAVCGARPGRLSAGWSTWRPAGRLVTCQKCLKRL